MTLSLTLTAQPGDSIEAVSRELQAYADRWRITCEAKFNDVKLVASPGGDPQNLVDGYWDCARAPGSVKLAFSTKRLRRGA